MADVISEGDLERLLSSVKSVISEGTTQPIAVIRAVMEKEGCKLSEAKEAYCLVVNDETLSQYQGRIFEAIDNLDPESE